MISISVVIEVDQLTKYYGKVAAVKNVSFEIKKGEIFGFLGPNGAGKTTTIKMLCGLLRPDRGYLRVLGKDIERESSDVYRRLGTVFEESNLYCRLSAEANLNFYAELYDVSRERVVNLLREYNLYEVRKRQVKNYSKGMKQRLLICRALLAEPELLILDEPSSGLDPSSASRIREAIKKFRSEGGTIFLSTHNMEEADELCDRLAFINQGQIVEMDSPEMIKSKYGGEQNRVSLAEVFLKLTGANLDQ